MAVSDVIGFAAAFGFGLWCLLLPHTVIRFYTWFHRGKVSMPPQRGVRLAGAMWLTLVAAVLSTFLARGGGHH